MSFGLRVPKNPYLKILTQESSCLFCRGVIERLSIRLQNKGVYLIKFLESAPRSGLYLSAPHFSHVTQNSATRLMAYGPEVVSKALVSVAAFAGGWNTLTTFSQRRSTIPLEGRLVTHSQFTCEVETED